MAKTSSIPEKFETLVSELKERYASGEKKAYYIVDLQKQNPDLETKRIKEWAKQVTGMSATDYFSSIGLLSPPEYYSNELFTDLSLEELSGKTFFLMSESSITREEVADMLQEYNGTQVAEYRENVDYVIVPKTELRKAPPEKMPGLDALLKKIEAEGALEGRFLYTYSLTERYIDAVRHRRMSDEQRHALGVIFSDIYNSPPELADTAECKKFKIVSKLKKEDIPVYEPETVYWTTKEFRAWFEAGGGEIRPGATLKEYSPNGKSFFEPHRIQKSFELFEHLCLSINTPEVQAYLCKKAVTTETGKLALNRVHRIASLGYIKDFDGCMTLIAKNTSRDTITVMLRKEPMTRHYDGMDYTLNKDISDGIPEELLCILDPPTPVVCPRRSQPGYLFVDCIDGELPKDVFANDPTIRYVEFSDRITNISSRAFANCSELEEIYFGVNTKVIGGECFINCKKIKRVIFPDSVKVLYARCFANCDSLEEISFSQYSSCENLGSWTFLNCKKLKRVVIPGLVFSINTGTFENCEKLETVDLPRTFAYIDSRAFAGCTALQSVSCERCLRNKVCFADNTFEGCPNLVLDKKFILEGR